MEEWFEREIRRVRGEIRRLIREVESLFEPLLSAESGEVEPLYEVIDAGDKLVVRVDLPKVERESIEILHSGDRLVVRARMREPLRLCDVPLYSRCEISGYRLELELPPNVSLEGARASFRSGLLEITLPKRRVYRVKVE